MNIEFHAREYASAAEMIAAAAERRRRLMSVKPPVKQRVIMRLPTPEPTIAIAAFSTSMKFRLSRAAVYSAYAGGEVPTIRRSMTQIARSVLADHHPDVTVADLMSQKRKKEIVLARHHVVYAIMQERPDMSYNKLGGWLNRDHTTVINSYRQYKAYLEKQEETNGQQA